MIRPVSYSDILAHPELLAEYAAECSIPEIGEFNPQAEMYAAMEASGGFKAFGVFHVEQMIGFFALLLYVLPHYGQKIATTESIFLASEHRNSSAGKEMLEFIEAYAKEQGCKVVLYTAPLESRFMQLLARKYRCTNAVFVRSL
jgi:GNAT superfamily N-acetyltransferase